MGKPVVVFGSFNADLTSRSKGLPVPGQTILGTSFSMGPGGKGSNQAVAAYRAGASVTLVTKIGRDLFGNFALDLFRQEGMNTDYILSDDAHATGIAVIMVDEITAQNEIVVISDACSSISAADVEHCRALIEGADILLLQHEINLDAQHMAIDVAHRAGVKIVLNPAPALEVPPEILSKLYCITPNETEAEALTGVQVCSIEDARRAARVFLDRGVQNVIITMGAMGAYATDGHTDELLPRLCVNPVDTTGAGDAFNGSFVMALSEGKSLFEALRYGNAAGALSVTRPGAAQAMPTRAEIDALVKQSYGI